jgi:ribonuclease-3
MAAVFIDAGLDAAREVFSRAWAAEFDSVARARAKEPKTELQEWAQARGLPTPAYQEISRTGPHHNPKFKVAVALPDRAPAEGTGTSKRAAEQAAAATMLTREGVVAEKPDA